MDSKLRPDIDWKKPDWQQVVREMELELTEEDDQEAIKDRNDKIEFCLQLIEIRNQKKLTQAELARKAGLTQAQIAQLESGKTNPTYQTIVRVARALDCKLVLDRR